MRFSVAALAVVLALSACGSARPRTSEIPGGVTPADQQEHHGLFGGGNSRQQNVGPCPLMGVLYDSSRTVQFAQPNVERFANITYTGEFNGVHGLCRYIGADPITMNMDVDMSFGRGPAGTADHQIYRYWVAVTQRGVAPIAKQYFDVDVRFPRGQSVATLTDHVNHIVIPRANATVSGENFEILVGFELTPEQLQFNRDGKRFRIDASGHQTDG